MNEPPLLTRETTLVSVLISMDSHQTQPLSLSPPQHKVHKIDNYANIVRNIAAAIQFLIHNFIIFVATPVWIRWWMLFVYAFGVWVLLTVGLVVLFVHRARTTARPKRKVPRRTKAKPGEANVQGIAILYIEVHGL